MATKQLNRQRYTYKFQSKISDICKAKVNINNLYKFLVMHTLIFLTNFTSIYFTSTNKEESKTLFKIYVTMATSEKLPKNMIFKANYSMSVKIRGY